MLWLRQPNSAGNVKKTGPVVLPGHALLQGILPTQGPNPCLLYFLHWQVGFTTNTTWEVPSIRLCVKSL